MKRRTFLAAASASVGVLMPRKSLSFAEGRRGTDTVVVLSDIGADTSLSGLEAALDALIAQGLPCLCVTDPAISSATALMPDDPRAALLRRVWADFPGLIELAPLIADLESQRPYFQARRASVARIQLAETLGLTELLRQGRMMSTIACLGGDERLNLDGLRSAGVRTILSLPTEAAVPLRNRVSPSNVLTMGGGRRVSFFDPLDQLLEREGTESHNVLVFPATEFAMQDVGSLAAATERFARAAAAQDLRGRGTTTLARDILVRDGTSYRRTVAVHLFDSGQSGSAADTASPDFVAMLQKAGIEHSTSIPLKTGPDTAGLGFWIPQKGQPMPLRLRHLKPANASEAAGAGVMLILGGDKSTWRGLDEAGNLHLPLFLDIADPLQEGEVSRALGALDDGVILIRPTGIATQAQRLSVLRALTALVGDGVTDLTSLPGLVAKVMPPDPLLPVMQRTEAASPAFRRRTGRAVGSGRDLLLEDAASAWAYFERFTDKRTGLCRAAASGSGSNASQYDRLTMWDIGSHINALLAAADLGLVDKAGFVARTTKVLRHLGGRKILGLLLPPEEVIVGTGRTTRNFNASDTGRLLASLARLAGHRFAEKIPVKALVASWNLKDVVIEGSLHSITRQVLVPADSSQYADYSSKGLAAWGIAAKTPYAGFSERGSADQRISFLETLSRLGPVGAEPVLLLALDQGLDPVSGYLADTLFAAMLAEFERNGRLLCPSETPLDRAPWFVYQGLQVDSAERPWRVLFDNNGKTVDESTDESLMSISCKGAYLWAAVIAHAHTTRLLEYVREKARGPVGFASCIYVDSGTATSGSSDINTNGIILQAVASMIADPDI